MQAATPLAAVFQFFVRDLAGMLGGVVFAFVQVGRCHTLLYSDVCVLCPCTMCCPFLKTGTTEANGIAGCAGF